MNIQSIEQILNILLVAILLLNFLLVGSTRVYGHIKIAAVQGLLISIVTILAHADNLTPNTVFLAVLNFIVMALLAPWMLRRAVREAQVQDRVEPYLGPVASQVLGIGMVILSFALFTGNEFFAVRASRLLPYAMSSVMFGLFLITVRKNALTQVIGYLVLANGVSLFGIALAAEQPLLVEMGILVDAFFAILVMGIAIYHINQEFDSIDTSRLDLLGDRK